MEQTAVKKSGFRGFPRNFWTVITMEFFERGSYYGVMSVLSVYLVMSTKDGGLGFSKESVGVIKSTITPILYFLPILSGAIADIIGYKKVLFLSFIVMSIGYLMVGFSHDYNTIFGCLIITVVGAGCFKPLISGTIARVTDSSKSTLGFGIFYWSINLGAFIFPLILIPYLKNISYQYIFFMASIGTGWLVLLNLFLYKEPIVKIKQNTSKVFSILGRSIGNVFEILYSPLILIILKCKNSIITTILSLVVFIGFFIFSIILFIIGGPSFPLFLSVLIGFICLIILARIYFSKKTSYYIYLAETILAIVFIAFITQNVFSFIGMFLSITLLPLIVFSINIDGNDKFWEHFKFLLMIVIYSGFWILYFQMFDTVLWYLNEYMDMTPVNNFVNSVLGLFMQNPQWKFEAEHVTVVNAGTIILLQILISSIVRHTKALPTMIVGISLGTIGMAILGTSSNAWVFIIGMFVFSLGEMTAHPKFISYVGLIAPADKKALYLGYSFLYGVIGSGIGGILGAKLYVYFVDTMHNPSALWFIFSLIGVATIIGLLLYNRFLAPKKV